MLEDNDVLKLRVKWLDEIKSPLLTYRILSDLGHGNLDDRIEALHKVIEAESK